MSVNNDETINEKTLEDEPNPQVIGEYTENLSDVSDGEDDNGNKHVSRNAVSTWYRVSHFYKSNLRDSTSEIHFFSVSNH